MSLYLKSKKGVWHWFYAVEFFLAMVIIGAVIYAFFPHLFENTLRFLNETGLRVPSIEEFVPYVPDLNLPPAVQTAQKSIVALKVAIESTAKGNIENNPFPCKSQTPKKTTGAVTAPVKKESNPITEKITEPCVECKNDNGRFVCNVKGFELPQKRDELGIDGWGKWIEGLADPNFILFYELFPANEETAWHTESLEVAILWMSISGAVNAFFPAAKELKALPKSGFRLIGNSVKKGVSKIEEKIGERYTKEGGEKVGKAWAEELEDALFPKKRIFSFLRNFGKAKRLLSEAELMRKAFLDSLLETRTGRDNIAEILGIDIEGLIARFGKDSTKEEILEEINRQFTKKSVGDGVSKIFTEIIDDKADDFIIKKVRDEEAVLRKVFQSNIRQDFDWFVAQRKVLKKEFPLQYDDSINPINDYTKITEPVLKQEMFEKIQQEAFLINKAKSGDVIKGIAKENIINTEIAFLKRDLASELFTVSRLNLQELKQLYAFRDFLSNLIEVGTEASGFDVRLNHKLVAELIRDAAKLFPKDKRLQEKVLRQFYKITTDNAMIDEEGYFVANLIGKNLDTATKKRLEDEFISATIKAVKENDLAHDVIKGIFKNTFGTNYDDGLGEFLKAQAPFSFKTAKVIGLKGALVTVPTGVVIGMAVEGPEGALPGGIIGGAAPALIGSTIVGTPQWVFKHRYVSLVALLYLSNHIENINEKKYPHGVNTLHVSRPYLASAEEEVPSVEFQLDDNILDYYIALQRVEDDISKYSFGLQAGVESIPSGGAKNNLKDITRFFLVSPCKADLKLTETNCICKANSGDDLYSVRSPKKGQHQLKKGTTKQIKPEVVYFWDNIYDDERKNIVGGCSEAKAFSDRRKECLKNLLNNDGLLNEFIEYIHPIVLNAKKFMEAYNDVYKGNKPLRDMSSAQTSPENINEYAKMRQDPNIIHYRAVQGGIIVTGTESIKEIVDENGLADINKFRDFIKETMRRYGKRHGSTEEIGRTPEERSLNFIRDAVSSLYNVNKNYRSFFDGNLPRPLYDDFFGRSKNLKNPSAIGDTIMWKTAREYVFHFSKITKENSNLNDAVKECDYVETTTTAKDIIEILKKEKPTVQEVQITGPCILINAEIDEKYKESNEKNYCFTAQHPDREVAKWLVTGVFLAGDLIIGTKTGWIVVAAHLATGAGAEAMNNYLFRTKWPER